MKYSKEYITDRIKTIEENTGNSNTEGIDRDNIIIDRLVSEFGVDHSRFCEGMSLEQLIAVTFKYQKSNPPLKEELERESHFYP